MACDLGLPQSLNRYGFVQGNPLSFTDASGLERTPVAPGGEGSSGSDLLTEVASETFDVVLGKPAAEFTSCTKDVGDVATTDSGGHPMMKGATVFVGAVSCIGGVIGSGLNVVNPFTWVKGTVGGAMDYQVNIGMADAKDTAEAKEWVNTFADIGSLGKDGRSATKTQKIIDKQIATWHIPKMSTIFRAAKKDQKWQLVDSAKSLLESAEKNKIVTGVTQFFFATPNAPPVSPSQTSVGSTR